MVAVASPRPRVRRIRDLLEDRRFLAPALIGPAVVFIVAVVGGALGLAVYLSFTDASGGRIFGAPFVGFDNFTEAWHNPVFRKALRNTILFTIVSQMIVLVCAGLLAHAFTRRFRGKWILRFLVLLPWAAPIPLGAIAWLWIYDSLFSVVNWTLIHDLMPGGASFHLYKVVNAVTPWTIEPFNPPQWLGDPTLALGAIISVHTWRVIPFATVIFLAGLASIPAEVEDAAKVDGATGLKKFWYVTLPLQLPIATVALLFGIVFTATDMTVVYILTQGGPFNSTQMLTTWAYQTGINGGSLGEGAAISLYLLPVLVVVAVGMLWFARKAEVT